jgi:hypothetical protein
MASKRADFERLRGDTWAFDIVVEFDADEYPLGLATDDVVLRCTIKRHLESADPAGGDLDEAALGNAQVDSDAIGGITILSSTELQVVFEPATTELFPVADLHFDVVIDFSATESWTLFHGIIKCTADVTLTRT